MIETASQLVTPGIPDPQQGHLWLLDLERHRPESYAADCLVLDDSELTRATMFRNERDHKQYCLSRTAVRNVLSCYCTSIEPAKWRFHRNSHGKPVIASPSLTQPLYFNISHSGRWLAIAIACNEKIGIDVELMSERRSMLAIARRYFTRREYSELCDLALEDLLWRFYGLWTIKEAYSKACGYALVPTLGELEISFSGESHIEARLESEYQPSTRLSSRERQVLPGWCLRLFEMEDYRLALAMRYGKELGGIKTSAWEIEDPLKPGAATKIRLEPCRWNC